MSTGPVASRGACVLRVMPIGDSICWGVGAVTLSAWMEGLKNSASAASLPLVTVGSQTYPTGALTGLPNMGFPGVCIALSGGAFQSLQTLCYPVVATYLPDVAILQAGTNDVGEIGADAPTVLASMSLELDLVWAAGSVKKEFQIVRFNLLERTDVPAYDTTIQAINAGLPALIASKPYASHITLVDIYNTCPYPAFHATNDMVHPNDAGYAAIATRAAPSFQAAMKAAQALT